ncbi:OmpH family outer membrane protein [Pseudoponticoccus marisrubri]|uniref:Outer membrane chaperone Skp n=1 Tax=Pseudoponticoccus marisrubri TaxID=1685382 RepID=A0A0W7WMX3_9RHOB|nr:OmpH family outer membrane protein [Pseudoponticoccus marisrubri]KUF11910.1 hypothetical protein AVJ23_04840 [Pseudoponticoccus marisrubri]
MRLTAILLALGLGLTGLPGAAQQAQGGPLASGVVQSPILVIEFDRVYSQSAFGQRVATQIEQDGAAIAAENRRIEAELTEEERALTDERPNLPPEEFRALADAFDEKVQSLRDAQDAKARSLATRRDEAQRRFLAAAQPVLERLMRDSNAAVILERRTVFAAAGAIDVTDEAIAAIDAAIGDGSGLAPAPPAPEPEAEPGDTLEPAPPRLPAE